MDVHVKAAVSPTSVYDTSFMYVAKEGRVLCDASRDDKLLAFGFCSIKKLLTKKEKNWKIYRPLQSPLNEK